MVPAFRPNDGVLVFNWARNFKKGSVVVFRLGNKKLIKRVKELKSDSLAVCSDNKKLAQKIYKVPKKDIVGRVFLKY